MTDQEDPASPLNTASAAPGKIIELLESSRDRAPFFCLLEAADRALIVGVGRDFGCAQHSSLDRKPPYLMAVAEEVHADVEFAQFLSGGQMSEVPGRYCLSWTELERIIVFFASNSGDRDPTFQWEEI